MIVASTRMRQEAALPPRCDGLCCPYLPMYCSGMKDVFYHFSCNDESRKKAEKNSRHLFTAWLFHSACARALSARTGTRKSRLHGIAASFLPVPRPLSHQLASWLEGRRVTWEQFVAVACVFLLVGCGSLPVPHRTQDTRPAVRIEGTRGPLSVQQSESALARKNGSAETDIFNKHLAQVDEISESPLMTGNKVTLLLDGPATYKSMYAAIRGAESNINMESYSIEDDEVGRRFADALVEKQKKGVQVVLSIPGHRCLGKGTAD